jgi:hypothetical protein
LVGLAEARDTHNAKNIEYFIVKEMQPVQLPLVRHQGEQYTPGSCPRNLKETPKKRKKCKLFSQKRRFRPSPGLPAYITPLQNQGAHPSPISAYSGGAKTLCEHGTSATNFPQTEFVAESTRLMVCDSANGKISRGGVSGVGCGGLSSPAFVSGRHAH